MSIDNIPVFLDISLKRFETVFPACGSHNSAIRLTCEELDEYSTNKKWVDVCKSREEGYANRLGDESKNR